MFTFKVVIFVEILFFVIKYLVKMKKIYIFAIKFNNNVN